MNETQNRTAADVVMQAVYEMSDDYLDVITVDMIAEGNYRNTLTWTTDHILTALTDAGYTIAGPGQEVVPVEVADAAQRALMEAPTRFAGREGEGRRICSEWRFGRKIDPLPTRQADPAQVVVDRERWERVRDAAEEMEQRIAERGWGAQYTRPGDLDQEGE